MKVREISFDNLNDIIECIYHHKTMYGITIDHDTVLKTVISNITKGKVWGCYVENECIGIATQSFWSALPVWVFSNVFVKNSSNLLMTEYFVQAINLMMQAAIEYAETRDVFEFYYVLRDSKKQSRKNTNRDIFQNFQPDLLQRYEIENIKLLTKPEDVNWTYYNWILGSTGLAALKLNKTLVIRRGRLKKSVRELG